MLITLNFFYLLKRSFLCKIISFLHSILFLEKKKIKLDRKQYKYKLIFSEDVISYFVHKESM